MIKQWFILLGALITGTIVGLALWRDPGYFLVAYQQYTIEMPLWLALMGFTLLLMIWGIVFNIPERWGSYWGSKREQKTLLFLEKLVLFSDEPSSTKTVKMSIDLKFFPIWLMLKRGQAKESMEAKERLLSLEPLFPKDPRVLKLLKDAALSSQDDLLLERILPNLYRYSKIAPQTLEEIHQGLVHRQLALINEENVGLLYRYWKKVPKKLQGAPAIALAYAKALQRVQQEAEAEKWIRTLLDRSWDPALINFYANLGRDPKKRLEFAQTLLNTHANEPELWSALGSLAKQNELWGQALYYYEQVLRLSPTPHVFWELAQLCQLLGRPQEQINYYQEGLRLATKLRVNSSLQKHAP